MMTMTIDELYHHGILGMHWGIRRYQNKDGSLTDAGKKRYADALGKNLQNMHYAEDPKKALEKSRLNSKPLEQATAKLKDKSDKIAEINEDAAIMLMDYENDFEKYGAQAAVVNSVLDGTTSMAELAGNINWYLNADGDQSMYNSVSAYLRDTNQLDKAMELYNRSTQANEEYLQAAKAEVSQMLGEYGQQPVYASNPNYTVVKETANQMLEHELQYKSGRGIWKNDSMWDIGNGLDCLNDPDRDKHDSAEKKAKAIIAKLTNNDRFEYDSLLGAVYDTGFDDVDFDDMTEFQWNLLYKTLEIFE